MEPMRFYRPVVSADSYHSEEELDPDPHYCGNLDPDLPIIVRGADPQRGSLWFEPFLGPEHYLTKTCFSDLEIFKAFHL